MYLHTIPPHFHTFTPLKTNFFFALKNKTSGSEINKAFDVKNPT